MKKMSSAEAEEKKPFVVGIMQARMSSSRLPGKVLRPLPVGAEGELFPSLAIQWARVTKAKRVDHWTIATTVHETDNVLKKWCEDLEIPCFRGSLDDVLSRYAECAKVAVAPALRGDDGAIPPALVVRLTADCPMADPVEVDRVVGEFIDKALEKTPDDSLPGGVKYSWKYNYTGTTFTRPALAGIDVEITPFARLMEADAKAVEQAEREHVMPYNKKDPAKVMPIRQALETWPPTEATPKLWWTLDTPQDYEFLQRSFAGLTGAPADLGTDYEGMEVKNAIPTNPAVLFSGYDVHAFLQKHPEIQAINTLTCADAACSDRCADVICDVCKAHSYTDLCMKHATERAAASEEVLERPREDRPGKLVRPSCDKCPQ